MRRHSDITLFLDGKTEVGKESPLTSFEDECVCLPPTACHVPERVTGAVSHLKCIGGES